MTDEKFDKLLNEAERRNKSLEGGAKDLACILNELGLEVKSQTYSFPESPRDSEFEIFNVRAIK